MPTYLHGDKSEDVKVSVNIAVPDDPNKHIQTSCTQLRELKSQLRRVLSGGNQIFKNIEMPEEWANASILVQSQTTWEVFYRSNP